MIRKLWRWFKGLFKKAPKRIPDAKWQQRAEVARMLGRHDLAKHAEDRS